MGSVEFGFGLLCQLPEVTVANMTYMSHGKPWLTILTFRDVRGQNKVRYLQETNVGVSKNKTYAWTHNFHYQPFK